MAESDRPLALELGQFIAEFSPWDLPDDVIARAKLCVLDQLGIQIRGSSLPWVQPALHYARSLAAQPESTVVVHGDRTAVPYAAFVNATFGNCCELDDAIFLGGHAGMHTIPAAVAIAEAQGLSGADVIAGVVAGYQAMARGLGPIYRSIFSTGWHGSQVSGVFGSAATSAKLLGLSPVEAAHALAIAGSSLGGAKEYERVGGDVKRSQAGMAVRSGIEASLLAKHGTTGPLTVFEGDRGVWSLFTVNDADAATLAEPRFHILDTIVRFYPAVGTVHVPLDALRRLVADSSFEVADIEEILVSQVAWAAMKNQVGRRPTDLMSAEFSLPFSLALRLVKNSNDLALYADPTLWTDPELDEVMDKVNVQTVEFEPGEPDLASTVELRLKDGRTLRAHERAFRGHTDNPATDHEIVDKFRELVDRILPTRQVDELVDAVGRLETVDAMSEVVALCIHP